MDSHSDVQFTLNAIQKAYANPDGLFTFDLWAGPEWEEFCRKHPSSIADALDQWARTVPSQVKATHRARHINPHHDLVRAMATHIKDLTTDLLFDNRTDLANQIKDDYQKLATLVRKVSQNISDFLDKNPASYKEKDPPVYDVLLDVGIFITVLQLSRQIRRVEAMRKLKEPDGREAPADKQPAALPTKPASSQEQPTDHGEDFTWVKWFGETYRFAFGNQSRSIALLWKDWEKDGLGLHEKTIGESVGSASDSFRLSDTFKDHPAWGSLIVRGDRKGIYRLKKPEKI
jgi:hypothetical protein